MPTQQDVWHRSNCKLDIWGFESRRASCEGIRWAHRKRFGRSKVMDTMYTKSVVIKSVYCLSVFPTLWAKLRSNSKVVGDMGGRCHTNTWTHQWWSATSSALGRSCLDKMQPPWQEALSWQSFVVQPHSFCSSLYDEKNAKQDMTISCPDCTSLYAATQSDLLSSFSFKQIWNTVIILL